MTLSPPSQPLASTDVEGAIAHLRAHGLRASAARRLVLSALLASDGPMSAEQIATGIGGRVPRSDLASVYRNLETLETAGIVRHVHLGHGPGRYTMASEGGREFLSCDRCGDFTAVDPATLDPIRALIRERFGYEASFRHFPIVGLCASCAEQTGGHSTNRGTA